MPGPEVAKNSDAAVERLFPHPPWPVVRGYLAGRTFLGAHGSRVQALLFLAFAGLLVGGGVAFLGFALWLGADRVRRVFVVPREDLHPFDFEETVRLRIRERAKQDQGRPFLGKA